MTGESQRRRVMLTHAIRALLLGAEDGMTAGELGRALGVTTSTVNGILHETYGCYIDRWAETERAADAAVWVCIKVPENCPRPEKSKGLTHAALESI